MSNHLDRDEIVRSLATKIAAIDLTDQEAAILDVALAGNDEAEVEGHAFRRSLSRERLVSSFQLATSKTAWCPEHGILQLPGCPHKGIFPKP